MKSKTRLILRDVSTFVHIYTVACGHGVIYIRFIITSPSEKVQSLSSLIKNFKRRDNINILTTPIIYSLTRVSILIYAILARCCVFTLQLSAYF